MKNPVPAAHVSLIISFYFIFYFLFLCIHEWHHIAGFSLGWLEFGSIKRLHKFFFANFSFSEFTSLVFFWGGVSLFLFCFCHFFARVLGVRRYHTKARD